MAKHAFFLNKGGSGGGGGTGGFALIKIEYPEGQEVTVTFNGETTTAPDTSGLWMYGCEETGTYTIAITGTTAEVEVEITTQGQIESVWISPQVINYALIYYLGNEFTNVEGTPEEKYAISTGGWNQFYKSTYVYASDDRRAVYNGYNTVNNINCEDYNGTFMKIKIQNTTGQTGGYCSFGNTVRQVYETTNVYPFVNNYIARNWNNLDALIAGGLPTNLDIVRGLGGGKNYLLSKCAFGVVKQSNCIQLSFSKYPSGGTDYCNFYACGFYKTDRISGLSDYGSDIATILSNATDLFTDISALNWMCLNCTGDFMISALANTNFINAMNASANKSILVANEHWNRFIALLSV